ncbi:MAG: beta-lactamase family protein [Cellulomonadaceae bacterium]|nr:beta-lactamase family protein [Cellulomonadaceae bacterium]
MRSAEPSAGHALAILMDGQVVVDVWGGTADARDGRAWSADTPTVVFSCTKGLVAIVVARLVQDGLLSYHEPVARYWPEFGVRGKGHITVGDLLAHRAGLPSFDAPVTFDEMIDGSGLGDRLAAQAPLWDASKGHSYHPITYGWLVGELVRRVSGSSVGHLLRTTVAEPLGADAWIGAPRSAEDRIAHVRLGEGQAEATASLVERAASGDDLPLRSMTLGGALPPGLVGEGAGADAGFNDPRAHHREIAGAGGVATASALATIWSSTVVSTGGTRTLHEPVLAEATTPRSWGRQVIDGGPPYPRFAMGVQLTSEQQPYLTPQSFGHDGAGGQMAFADPVHRLGFAFVTNEMRGGIDRRAADLVAAVREVLEPR